MNPRPTAPPKAHPAAIQTTSGLRTAGTGAPSGVPRTSGRGAVQQMREGAPPSPPAHRQRSRNRLIRGLPRPVRWVLQGTLALAFAGMLSLGVIFLMVQRGPISIGFLVGPIEEAIRRELGTARVEIESALLRQSEDGRGIEFRLANLRIKDAQGAVLAETPLAAINLSGAALLRGWLAPVSVEFIRPRLRLTTTPGGGIALAVSRPPDTGSSAATVAGAAPSPSSGTSAADKVADPLSPKDAPRQIDLIAALQDTMADFREGDAASAYLRELGGGCTMPCAGVSRARNRVLTSPSVSASKPVPTLPA